jgi:hypothetical protein
MPYVMEIGTIFSLLNDYLEDRSHMVQMLTELRDPNVTQLSQMEFFTQSPNPPTPATTWPAVVSHIETDWFGWDPLTHQQPPFNPVNPAQTGWWTRWYGNADQITRETLRRALEVALGVAHDAAGVTPSRQWRVMFTWSCGAPMFQGWVAWQWVEHHPQQGFVLGTFTTPGNGHPLYATPHRPPGAGPAPDYEDPVVRNPADVNDPAYYGMWIIGDQSTDVLLPPVPSWQPLGTGVLPNWPNAFVHTYGNPALVVSPAEEDGGVLRAGHSW